MSKKGRILLNNVLPFQTFLQKAKVITLFRKFIRGANLIRSQELKIDIRKQIRENFKSNRDVSDPVVIRHLFQDANRQLKMLEGLCEEKLSIKSSNNHSNDVIIGKGWPWNRN